MGTWQPEKDTRHSESFHDFLRNENVWLPATFQESQVGDSGTWMHTNGQWYRGDYVALPQQLLCKTCKAYVSNLVDASLAKEDHRAAFVELEACYDIFSRSHRRKSVAPFDEDTLLENIKTYPENLFHQLQTVMPPAWDVDVHTHVEHLSQNLTGALQTIYTSPIKKPRKTTMSDATWELVQRKRTVRNTLAALNQQQAWGLLRICWAAWKDAPLHIDYLREFDTILTNLDVLIAKDLHQFRSLGRLVSSAMRSDDVAFFSALAQEAAEFLGPGQAKQLWKVVRRSLPQSKQRRAHAPPMSLQHLDEQWLPHFHQLECGETVLPTTLVEACHQFQVAQLPPVGTTFSLDEFPSLAELEAAFRTTKAHCSVGLDSTPAGVFRSFAPCLAKLYFDVVMKEFTWGTEPIQHKGGPLAVIPKKPDWTVAKNFRGIMLLPTVSKRIHSLLREKILPLLAPVKPPGQIGGFRHQQTPFGSLAVRSLTRTLAASGHSVAVLFIDLSEAFHRLVRELVTGVVSDENAQRIIEQVEGIGVSAAGLYDIG